MHECGIVFKKDISHLKRNLLNMQRQRSTGNHHGNNDGCNLKNLDLGKWQDVRKYWNVLIVKDELMVNRILMR